MDKARNILLEEERREKTLDINTVGVGLIAIIRYSSKRTSSEKTIDNNMIYSRYEKGYEADIYWKLYSKLTLEWL